MNAYGGILTTFPVRLLQLSSRFLPDKEYQSSQFLPAGLNWAQWRPGETTQPVLTLKGVLVMACPDCMLEWEKQFKSKQYFTDSQSRKAVQQAYSDAYNYLMNKRSHWGEELNEGLQALTGIDDLKTFGDAQNGRLGRELLRTTLVNFRTQPGFATEGAVCLYGYRMRRALNEQNHQLLAAPAPNFLKRAQKSVCDFVNGGPTDSQGHIQRALEVMNDCSDDLNKAQGMSIQEVSYHAACLIWGSSARDNLPCPHKDPQRMLSPSFRAAFK